MEATSGVDVSNIISSVTGMLGDFNVENLLLFVGGGIALSAGLVLSWFGVKYLIRKLMGALKNARLG